jgi:hypothetical protein
MLYEKPCFASRQQSRPRLLVPQATPSSLAGQQISVATNVLPGLQIRQSLWQRLATGRQ